MRTASDEKGTKLGVRIEESGSGLKIHMLSTETTEESLDVNVGVIRGGVVYVSKIFDLFNFQFKIGGVIFYKKIW